MRDTHCVRRLVPSSDNPPHQSAGVLGGVTVPPTFPESVGRPSSPHSGNVTVAAYINRQGGTHSIPLNALAAQFWNWCRGNAIVPTAVYLPGQDNLVADFLSRGRLLPSEWTLHRQVMARVRQNLGPLQVDLFASSLNNQLPRYCSRAKDLRAWKIDAFSFNWGKIRAYAFPPIAMIPRVLCKIRQDQATVLLIAPWWPKRTWFLEGVSLLMDSPRSLPIRRDLLVQPLSGTLHHDPGCLHLTAWPLSGKIVERQDFQSALQSSSPAVTGTQPESYNARLASFYSWCDEQGVDPRSAPLNKIVDFLIYLFEK